MDPPFVFFLPRDRKHGMMEVYRTDEGKNRPRSFFRGRI